MKRITDYADVSSAVSRHFGRTTVTNCFIDRAAYEREISGGTLYISEYDGGLYILRSRDGFGILSFYFDSPESFAAPTFPDGMTAVCEVPYRERDAGLRTVAGLFTADGGFVKRFTRARYSRIGDTTEYENVHVRVASQADGRSVYSLLERSFDRLTGCIPTRDALFGDIADGHILVYDDGAAAGLLHFAEDRASSEIRHLAVVENRRGEGIASALVRTYLAKRSGRLRVWAREDYTDAVRVYVRNGYIPDGMKSDVFVK